jgi:hypothetical protein
MRESDDHDSRRPRPRRKARKRPVERPDGSSLWLRIAIGVAALLVVAFLGWGIVRFFSSGGIRGAVVAEARPALSGPESETLSED